MEIKRVLVTEATDFIGKELVGKLVEQGFEVHILERYVTGRYSLDQKDAVIKHYANLTDYNRVRGIIKEVQPNAVIHLDWLLNFLNILNNLLTDFFLLLLKTY